MFCDNLEGWVGVTDGRVPQEGGGITCDCFMVMYGRDQHNIIEQLSSSNCILFYTTQYCTIIIFHS